MEHTIYTQIPLTFTVRNILEKLHIPLDMENEFTELANKAKQIAQPKIAVRMLPKNTLTPKNYPV